MSKNRLITIIFFTGLFVFFLLAPNDPDLGWQLRCGQQIWQQGGWCQQNQFSTLLENHAWTNHRWLFQVILFPTFQLTGLWGLAFLNAFLMTGSFLFFFFSIKNYRWEKMIAIGLTSFFAWGVFSLGIRPQLMGFFFFNFILFAFLKMEERPFWSLFLPIITLFWANFHGSVILGLILISFLGLGQIVALPKWRIQLIITFLLSALVTLINPFGFGIYQDAWQHFAGQINLSKLIAEWVPPSPLFWGITFLMGGFLLFWLLFGKTRQEKISALLVLPFTFLALRARRNSMFFYPLVFFLFLNSSLTKRVLENWLKRRKLRGTLAVLTATFFLFISFSARPILSFPSLTSFENYAQKSPLTYPLKAIEFLKDQPQKGNLFNRYEWGGFLIWQLPEYKIFVDGRMPAWETSTGESPYTIYLKTLQNQPGWQETLKEYNLNWILISPGTFMDLKLRDEPRKFGWEEVYRDKISVVYKRI